VAARERARQEPGSYPLLKYHMSSDFGDA
jgi:hypothetical protein